MKKTMAHMLNQILYEAYLRNHYQQFKQLMSKYIYIQSVKKFLH